MERFYTWWNDDSGLGPVEVDTISKNIVDKLVSKIQRMDIKILEAPFIPQLGVVVSKEGDVFFDIVIGYSSSSPCEREINSDGLADPKDFRDLLSDILDSLIEGIFGFLKVQESIFIKMC